MKVHHLFLIFSALFFNSCNNSKASGGSYSTSHFETADDYENKQDDTSQTKSVNSESSSKRLKLYKIKNEGFGMLFGVMPIPNYWNIVNNKKDGILFESENGTKVYGERFTSFYYSNNQELNYYYQQSGNQVKPLKDINQVLNEDFKPLLESQGLKQVGQFPLPQLAKLDKQLDKALFKSIPEEKTFQCIVTEWEDQNGTKSLGIIRYFTTYYPTAGSMNWGYVLNGLEAPKVIYENAKKDYINALLNLKVNPNWIQKNNQYYAQKTQQSNAGHQQRMAALRAHNQAIVNTGNTYSSINDSNHESWKRRSTMTDAGHSKYVNAVWERSNVTAQSGNQYQVEGYYNTIWKTNNNEYIGTDNTNWNPNLDNSTNGINWEQLEYSDDNY